MDDSQMSILFPKAGQSFRKLSDETCHDLGLDTICKEMSDQPKEQKLIMNILSEVTSDCETACYRHQVFTDILALPEFRQRMSELFDRIEFLREFGTMKKKTDDKLGIWYLLHRLDELSDYIKCVEAMKECLDDERITSEGLLRFREHIDSLYEDSCFAEMKKDISALKMQAEQIQSVTLGVNLNERFEATSLGLISINSKPFKKSGIVSTFADAIASKNKLQDSTEWNGDMHYQQVEKPMGDPLEFLAHNAEFMVMKGVPMLYEHETTAGIPDGDGARSSTFYLEGLVNRMLDQIVKKLRDTLTKYVNVAVVNISKLIPEFIYYIRCAEFIGKLTEKGYTFCSPVPSDTVLMHARGFYNLKLALNVEPDDIVTNDLDFDKSHCIYILTGANRGGKTTATQASGLLYVLAQGGISVPCSEFEYKPVDCIYTHFPADEDKTMDLGRLGEECVRFRDIYNECTRSSLVLLNETFSTTSF